MWLLKGFFLWVHSFSSLATSLANSLCLSIALAKESPSFERCARPSSKPGSFIERVVTIYSQLPFSVTNKKHACTQAFRLDCTLGYASIRPSLCKGQSNFLLIRGTAIFLWYWALLWGKCKFVLELCRGHHSKSIGHWGDCCGSIWNMGPKCSNTREICRVVWRLIIKIQLHSIYKGVLNLV